MGGLVWPAFCKLPGVPGVGVNVLRSPVWSQLDTQGIAASNPIPIRIVGRNPSPPTSAPAQDIWPAGGARALPSAGFTIAVASDSANDTSAGTGAQQITVPYLDANYVWHYAIYNLNGTAKVSAAASIDGGAGGTVSNALRILPWTFVSAVGTGGVQAGNIYVGNNTDAFTSGIPAAANMYDKLLAGDNRSNLGAFTVPAGMALLLLHGYVMCTQAGTAVLFGKAWQAAASWGGILSAGGIWTPAAAINPWIYSILGAPAGSSGMPEFNPNWPDLLLPQSELKWTGLAGAASAEITVIMEGALIPWPISGGGGV